MNDTARSAYLDASIATASPARLLVMLCDRLVLDVRRGLEAEVAGDPAGANRHLLHAQDIVLELRASLRPDDFEGGHALDGVYEFLHAELVRANVSKDAARADGCLALAEQLRDTWREAAMQAAVS